MTLYYTRDATLLSKSGLHGQFPPSVLKQTVWNMIILHFFPVFNDANVGRHPLGSQWKWWRISIFLRFYVLQPIRLPSWGALCRVQLRITFKLTGCAHYINIADGIEVGGITDKIVQPAFSPIAFFPLLFFFGQGGWWNPTWRWCALLAHNKRSSCVIFHFLGLLLAQFVNALAA